MERLSIVGGDPAGPFPRRLHRPDVPDLAFTDRFGVPLNQPSGE